MLDSEITEEEIRRRAEEVFSAMEKRSTQKEMQQMRQAFEFAHEMHRNQRRKTGAPYIIHPIAVALIISKEMQLGAAPVCAAFLHDVVEDTPCTNEQLRSMFGDDIAFLVKVVTKQQKKTYSMSKQLDNFKQMLDSVHYDIRAILIKLADRLHNMRTLASMRPDKQMKIAGETDYFYAPLANRLGLYTIKIELENLSFQYRCPHIYDHIKSLIEKDKKNDHVKLEKFEKRIDSILQAEGIQYRRETAYKQPYNIWRKMNTKQIDYEHLEGRHFTRIIFPENVYVSEKDMCLKIYSLLTSSFKERPKSMVNYVDQPKQNGYESFHVQLLSDYGVWEELHIQSERMSKKSKLGYMFDDGKQNRDINEWLESFRSVLRDVARTKSDDNDFFIESVRASFYNDDIQVYTPDGRSLKLPKNSSAIDFAFAVHTELGMHAKYAKINGHLASVKKRVMRGDSVEIGTSPDVWPQPDWLDHVKSYKAMKNIRLFIDKMEKPKYCRCKECNPIPGEEVIGFTNDDGSIEVHRRDCGMAIGRASQYGDSIVAVDFQGEKDVLYPARVTLYAVDRQHLLSDIIDSISNKLQLSIDSLHTVTEDQIVTTTIDFEVHDYDELQTIVDSILSIPDVDEVSYNNK